MTRNLRLKRVRKVIDKDLDKNITAMKNAAQAAGRHDLDGVYEQLRENQSRPQLVYEERVEKAPGIIAKLRRQQEEQRQEKERQEQLVSAAVKVAKKSKPSLFKPRKGGGSS